MQAANLRGIRSPDAFAAWYLFTVLNWSVMTPVDLKKWPAISAYAARLRDRPSVAKAFAEERALYAEAQARHKASA